MGNQLDEISEAIGGLRAEVKNLGRKIDQADQNSIEGNRRADEHRVTIHRRVDDLLDEIGDLKSQVNVIDLTAKDAKAVTDKVKQWEAQGKGALFVAGIASAAISSTVVGFLVYWWDAIMKALRAA